MNSNIYFYDEKIHLKSLVVQKEREVKKRKDTLKQNFIIILIISC